MATYKTRFDGNAVGVGITNLRSIWWDQPQTERFIDHDDTRTYGSKAFVIDSTTDSNNSAYVLEDFGGNHGTGSRVQFYGIYDLSSVADVDNGPRFILRASGADGSENGYVFYHAGYNSGQIGVGVLVSGTYTEHDNVPSFGISAATLYRIRGEVEGTGSGTTTLRLKVWEDGTTEPGSWDIDHTVSGAVVDTDGEFALDMFNAHTHECRWHAVSLGVGEDAPDPGVRTAITLGSGGWQEEATFTIHQDFLQGTGTFPEFSGTLLTEAFLALDPNLITLGHADAIDEADIKMVDNSYYDIPFHVVRWELNADPTLSKCVIVYALNDLDKESNTTIRCLYDYDGTAPTIDADSEFGSQNAGGKMFHSLIAYGTPDGTADDIVDSGPFGLHRTSQGSMATVEDFDNGIKGLLFDGTDDYLERDPIGQNRVNTDSYLFEAMVRFDDPTGRGAIFGEHTSGGLNENVLLAANNGIWAKIHNNNYDEVGYYVPKDGKEHHLCLHCTDDGSSVHYNLYVDGVGSFSHQDAAFDHTTTNLKASEGQEWDAGATSDHFEGLMGFMRMFTFEYEDDYDMGPTRGIMMVNNARFHGIGTTANKTAYYDPAEDTTGNWPSEFSQHWTNTEPVEVEVQVEVDSLDGKVVEIPASDVDFTEQFLRSDSIGRSYAGESMESLIRFKCVTFDAENGIRHFARINKVNDETDGIMVFADPDGGGRIGSAYWNGGAFSILETQSFTLAADTWYWFRASVSGSGSSTVVKGKIWSGTLASEPATWTMNDDESTTLGVSIQDNGDHGIGKYGGSPNSTFFDWWGIGYGTSAPDPDTVASEGAIIANPGSLSISGVQAEIVEGGGITAISPTEAPVGTAVTISGVGFTNVTDVTFNGVSVDSFTVVSSTEITTTVPSGATTGDVVIVRTPNNFTSPYTFVVLPDLPADGWNFELFQIVVNGDETDVEVVSGTLRSYQTEGLDNDFIPISASNLEETLEWDEGVYRLSTVDVTVQNLEDTYFNTYTSYITAPYVLVIRDPLGNTIFHGPIDPESCRYNAANRATAFRVLSWDVLLEGTNTPCRSIYETQFSQDYSDAIVSGQNSTVYFKKVLNGVDLSTIVTSGSVLVFNTPVGEYRSIVITASEDGDDLEVFIAGEPTIYLMQSTVVAPSAHSVSQTGGVPSFNRLKIEISDPVVYEFLESSPDTNGNDTTLLLNLIINDGGTEEWVIDLYKEFVNTSGAWFFLDDDRQTIRLYTNIADSAVPKIEANGTILSITSQTNIKAGDSVKILGPEMYGYNNVGAGFEPLLDFKLNGGVIQGMFALPELGVLPYIVDTFVFPAGFEKRFTRFGELPPQLLDALRQIQNTFGLFTRLTPRMEGGLPKITVTIKDRDEANSTDSTVISDIVDILAWSESSADLTPTAVVVEPHILYFAPSDRDVQYLGFHYNGIELVDPAITGRPQNGRVVNITVNQLVAFSGDTFFGDGPPVINDAILAETARKFYEYYNALQRPCEFVIDGTPTEDLLGKVINISITDDPIAMTTFDRTVFVTGVNVDMNTNQTTIKGRIGEFQGVTGQSPTAVVAGQLIWNDGDGSGDETITLSGLQSYDPQNDPLTFEWSHSVDGVLSTEGVLNTVLDVGEHTITLTVTDPDMNTDSQVVTVRVTNQSQEVPDGVEAQAQFVTQSYGINGSGDLIISVNGDGNTQTTGGIKVRTAGTQVGLDSAMDTAYDNPQFNQTIHSALETGETLWVRVTLINSVDGTDSVNVWEFSVTNTGATTALIIPAGNSAPTSTADTTGVDGEIRADGSYIYVKITGTGWLRSPLSSF